MNKIFKIAVLALLVMGLFMACIGCEKVNSASIAETTAEVLSEEDALKKQVEKFPEKIVITGHEKEEGAKYFNTFVLNHPEYFWLPLTFSYQEIEDGIEIPIEYPYETDKLRTMKKALETKVGEIIQAATPRVGDYEKALFVHDYIADNCKYASEIVDEVRASENAIFFIENTAYGCLLEGRALCAGYSRAYLLIMNKLGIEGQLVNGVSKEDSVPHAWNIIKMDDEYYHVDVTWDDTADDDTGIGAGSYTYFGVTTKEILETRTINEEVDAPECTATENNYFIKNGYYLDTYDFDSLKPVIESQLMKGKIARVKIGSEDEANKAMTDLFVNHRIEEIITESSIIYILSNKVITIVK